jgi:hypothetical protein
MIRLSDESRRELREFAAIVEHELRDGERFEHIKDWAGNLPGAAARVAGLLHCAKHALGDPAKEAIDLITMRRALDLGAVLSSNSLPYLSVSAQPAGCRIRGPGHQCGVRGLTLAVGPFSTGALGNRALR